MPAGAVTRPTKVELTEQSPTGSTGKVIVKEFELNATDIASGSSVTQFNKPLQISIKNYPAELAGLNPDSLRLYYLDEKSHQWIPLPGNQYDKKTGILTATTTHFTNFGEIADSLAAGPGRIMASQVDLHSGAATFSYPFELPPGPEDSNLR